MTVNGGVLVPVSAGVSRRSGGDRKRGGGGAVVGGGTQAEVAVEPGLEAVVGVGGAVRGPRCRPPPRPQPPQCSGGVVLIEPSSQVISTVTPGWASSDGTTSASQLSPRLIRLLPGWSR